MKLMLSVWTGAEFISAQFNAKNWNLNELYLYKIPPSLHGQKNLISALEILEGFSQNNLVSTLNEISKDFGILGMILTDEACCSMFREFIQI